MATAYTSLLGFALPVTGELSGTWGDTVNDSITKLVEDSIAGVASVSVTSGDVTLTTTGSGAANQARCAIIIATGTPGTARNIIAPSQSKAYVVINQSDSNVTFKGAATSGHTLKPGDANLLAWNGSDFIDIEQGDVAGPASATDNAVVRFDGTTGKLIQNSAVTIADTTGDIETSGKLVVGAGTNSLPSLTTSGDTNTGIFFPAAGTIAFAEGGAEAMRIDSGGRLIVGNTSSNSSFNSAIQAQGNGLASTALLNRFETNAGGPVLYLAKSRSGTVGTNTIVNSDDELGSVIFNGANGTGYSAGAQIAAFVDGTPGASNDMPGRLVFYTSADGSATPTERMRIDSSGNVGIGTSTPGAKQEIYVTRTSSTNAVALILNDNVTGAQTNGVYKSIRSLSNNGSSVSEIRFLETDGTNNNTGIAFATQSTAAGLTERARFNNLGPLVFAGGNTNANGIGITFPATQSASSDANTLDDYEEGTFTPTLTGTTVSAGTLGGTYTKIGNVVYVAVVIDNATFGSSSGMAQISSLPFTVFGNTSRTSSGVLGYNNGTVNASNSGWFQAGTTNFTFYKSGGAATESFSNGTAKYINMSGFYYVA
jgi:hypothetical protein